MGEGGRFAISKNHKNQLPENNLNFMVQELGLGKRATLTHSEAELSRL